MKVKAYGANAATEPLQAMDIIPIPCHSFPSSDVKRDQLRIHNDRMAPGICVNLFQASQQASTISS